MASFFGPVPSSGHSAAAYRRLAGTVENARINAANANAGLQTLRVEAAQLRQQLDLANMRIASLEANLANLAGRVLALEERGEG